MPPSQKTTTTITKKKSQSYFSPLFQKILHLLIKPEKYFFTTSYSLKIGPNLYNEL